jgi:hypothetical protein
LSFSTYLFLTHFNFYLSLFFSTSVSLKIKWNLNYNSFLSLFLCQCIFNLFQYFYFTPSFSSAYLFFTSNLYTLSFHLNTFAIYYILLTLILYFTIQHFSYVHSLCVIHFVFVLLLSKLFNIFSSFSISLSPHFTDRLFFPKFIDPQFLNPPKVNLCQDIQFSRSYLFRLSQYVICKIKLTFVEISL